MSVKAKIEAVIYASEEPVTLLQLVGLLGQEAQTELDALRARQGELEMPANPPILLQDVEAGDPDALNAETLDTEVFTATAPGAAEAREPERLAADADAGPPAKEDESPAPETPGEEADRTTTPGPTASDTAGQEPSAAELRARERGLREYVRSLLDELVAEYRDNDRGLEVREVAGGFRFATKAEYHDAVRGFVRSLKPPLKLSLQALETLAVVAYKQPITAPEVSEIRGVDSGGVLGSLMTRKLVATAGRKQVIGRPILYKTTREFLLRFGLKDVSELPSIEEFERLAAEINEAVQEEIPMNSERLEELRPGVTPGDAPNNLEPMRNEHAAQADGIPDETSAENTAPAEDAAGEFTADETAPPADNVAADGRISGVPPTYGRPDRMSDSPLEDARVQSDGTKAEDAGGNA